MLSQMNKRVLAHLRVLLRVVFVGWFAKVALASAAGAALALSGTPVTRIAAAKYYSFQPTVAHANAATMRFSIVNKPAWAGFDPATGRLFGTPIPANVGTYRNIVIRVTDSGVQAVLAPFAITVGPLNNHAPVISGVPAGNAMAGQPYVFQAAAFDPDGDRFTFQIRNKPVWLSLDARTGRLAGTPSAADVGSFDHIELSATDGYARGSLPAFRIRVLPAPAPRPAPYASVVLQWEPPTANSDASPLLDLAGYRIHYGATAELLAGHLDVLNAGIATYVVEQLKAGTWYFAVAALNAQGIEGDLSNTMSTTLP